MSDTLVVESLPDGMRKVSIRSKGQRDMSVKLSAEALDALVAAARNDESRAVHATEEVSAPAAKEGTSRWA